ncbi:MAG: 50S ribosomal protein L16 [Verrucomicrobia bacterium]|nr:50S ribosomal protein L16 [Verrucomicrobiota bacterium]
MPLMPKRVKYRKQQRGSRKGFESRAVSVDFGEFGLQALERAWMTAKQIEAARVAIARFTKRRGKLWLRVFPDKSVSKKPAETRMGKGKGAPEFWVAIIRPGRVMFELGGVPEPLAKEAFRLAAGKLPIKTRFVSRIS